MKLEYEPDLNSLIAFTVLVVCICATFVTTRRFYDQVEDTPLRALPAPPQKVVIEVKIKPEGDAVEIPMRLNVQPVNSVVLPLQAHLEAPGRVNLKADLELQVHPKMLPGALAVPVRLRVEREAGQAQDTDGDLLPPPEDVK